MELCIMASFIICTARQILLYDPKKEDDSVSACSTHGKM
jgi:hypothetical protein